MLIVGATFGSGRNGVAAVNVLFGE
jgi:hypothetical protein